MVQTLSPARLQRTRGRARVTMTARGLKDLHQSGAAKAILPRVEGPAEVVFLNISGGITGGDRLDYALRADAGTPLVATTQTAERAYRSIQGAGQVTVDLDVGAGASLDWLPQETILFDGSNLRRRLNVDLAADARFLFCEMLVFGRAAMGERITSLHLSDQRTVRRAGRIVFAEPTVLTPQLIARRASSAVMSDATAVATIGLFVPDAAQYLGGVRAAVRGLGGASAWNGKLIVRLMGPDAFELRKALARCLRLLRATEMPRVWQI